MSVVVKNKPLSIEIVYMANKNDISKKWGCEPRKASGGDVTDFLLIEEILERLEKMDRERKYCNRFSRDLYSVASIRAKIDVVNDELDILDEIAIPTLEDLGYPEHGKRLKEQLARYCTIDYARSL